MTNFLDTRHTLYVGWVLGIALRNELPVRAVLDDDDNYTDRLTMDIGEGVTITFVVPPPPDDWTLD